MAVSALRIRIRGCAMLLVALILYACQPGTDRPPEPVATPPAWPLFDYAAAAADGAAVLRLAPQRSTIDVVVRREGPLARFGHDHVVTVTGAQGYLLLAPSTVGLRADLRFAVEALEIDSAEARQKHALTTEPDADAIRGTRDNLLQHVLDSQRWPWVQLALTDFRASGEDYSANIAIDINGEHYTGRHAFRLSRAGAAVIVAGFLPLRQTALGLQPFSTLGGGLRVADTLEIHYRLEGMPQ
jgi:hypothetical protein